MPAGPMAVRLRRDWLVGGWVGIGAGLWVLASGTFPASVLVSACGLVSAFVAPAWALVLLAIAAVFERPAELFGWGTVYTGEMLLAVIVAGVWQRWSRRRALRFRWTPVLAAVMPLAAAIGLSAARVGSAAAVKGALHYLEFWLALAAGVIALRRWPEAERLVWALVAAAAISALLGIRQFFTPAFLQPELPALFFRQAEVVRAGAGFGPNTLAMYLCLLWPFSLAAAVHHPHGWGRLAGLVATPLLLLGTALTFSVTGALASLVALLLLLLGLGWKYSRPAAGWLALAGSAAVIGIFLYGASDRAFWIYKLVSFKDRLDYAQVVAQLFAQAPTLGVGPGQYKVLAPLLGAGINPVGLVTHPHSLYLTLLAELGILGLVLFLWPLGRLLQFVVEKLRGLPAGWSFAAPWTLLAGACGFLAANFFEHGLIHDRGTHAALVLAALVALSRRPDRARRADARHCFNRWWQQPAAPISAAALTAELACRRQERGPLYAAMRDALPPGKKCRVLELGCGLGYDALNLAERSECDVYAVDSSRRAVSRLQAAAQALGRKLQAHAADARHTGLPAGSFDLVYSQGLLEHFPDPHPVWEEMKRLAKADGLVLVDVPQTLNPYTLTKAWHLLRGDWAYGWETQFAPGTLRAQAREHGLVPVSVSGYGYWRGRLDWTYGLKRALAPHWPAFWSWLERHTGAWWMMNVVMLAQKGQGRKKPAMR